MSTLPNPNPIPNDAQISYSYVVDPSLPLQSGSNLSNIAKTQVNEVNMSSVKAVNLAFADIGNTLTYTIVLKNQGNSTANNVLLTDTIPTGTAFVNGSITINGVSSTGSPDTGIGVGSILPNQTTTVVFQVTVVTIPVPNPIPNSATGTFVFTLDPSVPNGQPDSTNTNVVTTQVNHPQFNTGSDIIKRVNLAYAKVGDTLVYTISMRNSGTTTANTVVFADTIPSGTTFVPNSVVVNGAPNAGNPGAGIAIGNIGVGQTTTVVFQVVVFTLPVPNPVPNSSTIGYSYIIDPSLGIGATSGSNSNIVNTQVNTAIIDNTVGKGLVKSVDKTTATIGDTVTYTVAMKNTGNVAANGVVFTDTIPAGTSFIPGSVRVNGTASSSNPQTGVTVGTIGVGNTSTVTFQVTVITLPAVNPIPNAGTLNFTYTVDPSLQNGQTGSGNTNTVTTQVNTAIIDNVTGNSYTKSVDKAIGAVGDTLTYTMVMRNVGNVAANNVIFRDTIPTGTTFLAGSATINGASNPGNPQTGITIGTILAGGVTTVTFKVVVAQTLPAPNPIPNTATTSFAYTVNPSIPNGQTGVGSSNTVITQINSAIIDYRNGNSLNKAVDKAVSQIGETLTYTIVLRNTGNVTADNVVLTDTIPNGTVFVASSLTVNGVPNVSNPQTGVNVGSISPTNVVTIQYNVTVITFPNPNPIPNSGTVNFSYVSDPSLPANSGTGNSNIVTTQVNQAIVSSAKTVDKANAKLGDTLTYTVAMTNKGNVTANNVIFFDTVPNATAFVTNSVTINGGANPGNPAAGINVGNIGPNQVISVAFNVIVTSIPTPSVATNISTANYTFTLDPTNPNGASGSSTSNPANTNLNQASIDTSTGGMVKAVDKGYADIGDTLTYTIRLQNTGNTTANNVVFSDTIPTATQFVTSSLTVNGVPNSGNPAAGINVGSIGPKQVTTVTFKVFVLTLPITNPVPNNSTVGYTYIADPSAPPVVSGGNSNTVVTTINNATINNVGGAGFVKTVDNTYAKVGDTLTYSIGVKNTGNVAANNVTITDTIPGGTTFIANSVTVNGTPNAGNPQAGINIGSVNANAVTTVIFKVVVTSLPAVNPIPNTARSAFTYTVDPSSPNGKSGAGTTNTVTTQVNQATIDNQNGNGLIKSVDKAYATFGDTVTFTIGMRNTGNVTANSVILKDTIPQGTTFVTGSVLVNGSSNPGNPQTGINVGNIGPGAATTLAFSVIVNSTLPLVNPIPNNATVGYTFTSNPSVPNGSTGSGNSNTTTTQINAAPIDNVVGNGFNKVADKSATIIGDTITYTLTLKNTGNVTANNVTLTDTIPNGTAFIPSSLTVDGVPNLSNPQAGISIGNIAPNVQVLVRYQVYVTTFPNPNPIPNSGTVNYTYTTDPSNPNGTVGKGNSNIALTNVNQAIINTNKVADKQNAKLGDTITYTLALNNSGNVTATNVVFADTVPQGTVFVPNSMTVNGSPNPGTPSPGINIGNIVANQVVTVTFQVIVTSIPTGGVATNISNTSYQYTVDPSNPNGGSGSSNSNPAKTNINQAQIDVNSGGYGKAVDKPFADKGDTITYTLSLKNTGTVTATNVVVVDTVPNGTVFVPNSVTVNGGANAGNPNTGIAVGSIAPNQVTTVVFRIFVTTIPVPNPIVNIGTVSYNYTVDPSTPNGAKGGGNSNPAITQVNNASINYADGNGLVKATDKAYVAVGDTINYTINLKNTGNVTATTINFTDTIPNGTTFVPGSVKINGTTNTGNPATGINVGNLGPSVGLTVTFAVVVTTVPVPNPIPNQAAVSYAYTVDPSVPNGKAGFGISNIVTSQLNQASIDAATGGFGKTPDKAYADVGDTITYTMFAKNTGNVTATNVIISDTIPNGTSFIPGSVIVNTIPNSGNPQNGINIGNLAPNQVTTILFSVKVTTIPTVNPIPNQANVRYNYTKDPSVPNGATGTGKTNISSTTISHAEIANGSGGLVKSADATTLAIGDTVAYTTTLRNTGNTTANNVLFQDTIPVGMAFIPNSLSLNGQIQTGINPQAGVNVGAIGANTVVTVTFITTVTQIPVVNPIPNQSQVGYSYTVDPSVPNGVTTTNQSNIVLIQINSAIIDNASGGLVKTVDRRYGDLGDTLTYTILVKNTGNVAATNVILYDTIPGGTSLIQNSVTVNGTPQPGANPQTGIGLNTIGVNTSITVTFKVLVSTTTIPITNPVPNNSVVVFSFDKCQ